MFIHPCIDRSQLAATGRHAENGITVPARRASFEVAHFVSHPISLRDFPWFFLLVLRVSSTRSRTRRYGNEYDYEYHFIEYKYGAEPRVRNFKTRQRGNPLPSFRHRRTLAGATGWYCTAIRGCPRGWERTRTDTVPNDSHESPARA
jgi:hypothetical protein